MARRTKVHAGLRGKRGSTRRIKSTIIVHRTAERGPLAFEACLRIGAVAMSGGECGYGRNPRKALANAMTKMMKHLRTRKGAFAGRK